MKKRRICFVISEDWYFLSHRFEFAKKLRENGFDISLICKFTKYEKLIKNSGIQVFNIDFKRSKINFLNDLMNIFFINKILLNNNFNIVHSVGIKPILITSISCIFNKKNSLIFAFAGMGHIFTSKSILNFIYKKIFVKIINLVSRKKNYYYLVQNSFDKDILIKLFNINKKKIFLVPGSGINTEYFYYQFKNNCKNNKIKILMHSRILVEKGVKEFYEVSKILLRKKPNIKFILIGKIDTQNPTAIRLNDLLEWSKQSNFEWLDYKEDIRSYIYDADISCLPSYREGLPKSILEDCSTGTPVICSDIPGCNSIITHEYNGLLIKTKSSQSLLLAILILANDHKKRLLYAERSRKIIEDNFSLNIIYKKMIKVYENI